jgi:hypothetical protein
MRPVLEVILDRGFQGGLFEINRDWGPSVITGFGRLNGEPVAVLAPQPKPETPPQESGRGPFYGSTLDSESAEKFAEFVDLVNVYGLPLLLDPAFAGFMPDKKNVSERVYHGGRRMVRALANFRAPIIMWAHPFFEWWGGAVAVTGKEINPNSMHILADRKGAMGILGSEGAMEVPKVATPLNEAIQKDPRVIEMNERFEQASGREERERLERERQTLIEDLRRGKYQGLLRAFWKLLNTSERAADPRVGSIHEEIKETGRTRELLIQTLQKKRQEIEERNAAEAADRTAQSNVIGGAYLTFLPYQMLPNGEIELTINRMSLKGPPVVVQDMIRGFFRTMWSQMKEGDWIRVMELLHRAQQSQKDRDKP